MSLCLPDLVVDLFTKHVPIIPIDVIRWGHGRLDGDEFSTNPFDHQIISHGGK